jgi:hypothetical protein
MSSDSLTYQQSSTSEGTPQIFVRKDCATPIVDQQNGSYRSNQSVLDTSAISNSNVYASYRESFLAIPLVESLSGAAVNAPNNALTSMDYACGLKSWFGQVIHSLQIEISGTQTCQTTSFANIYNYFKLMTSLSWNDVQTMGSSIGFHPDNALSIAFAAAASTYGTGTCNYINAGAFPVVTGTFNSFDTYNQGFLKRQQYINYDADGLTAPSAAAYSTLLDNTACGQLYKSYISSKSGGAYPYIQHSIMGIVYLRHLHSFFNQLPLMKGVFMKITLWLNQPQTTLTVGAAKELSVASNVNPLGGTNPLMIASSAAGNGSASMVQGAAIATLFVGNRCENTTQTAGGVPQ